VGKALELADVLMSRWIVAAAAVLCLTGYVLVYSTGKASVPIRSDGFSYYVYLPSWFLYHDTTLSSVARDCCGGDFPDFTAIVRWPGTRQWVNAHPIGVAVMQTPFFLAAHALTRWSNLSPDGFSLYYQHAAGLSGLAWIVAGLWVLRDLLRRHFSDGVTAATLISILFGTNLYHYATYDSSYSHPYSFFLFAALLDLTDRWHRSGERHPVLLGLTAGLIVLTRHTNALALLVFPLYGAADRRTLREAGARLARDWRALGAMLAVAAAVVLPQLVLYYRATGHALVSSYGSLGFNFASPHVFGVLFSVQKGVFFWSPLLLLAVAGLFFTRGTARAFVLPSLLFLAVNTYLIASWWDWQFGASYGHRGFVDSLPMLSIGLASVYSRANDRALLRHVLQVGVSLAVALSLVQMLQYWNGVLPFSDTTWDQYRRLFLHLR
jgi:hypothetical protein